MVTITNLTHLYNEALYSRITALYYRQYILLTKTTRKLTHANIVPNLVECNNFAVESLQ